jgi:hypothetical protein
VDHFYVENSSSSSHRISLHIERSPFMTPVAALAYGRSLPPESRIATGAVFATPSLYGCQKQKAPPLNQEAGLF